MTTTIELFRCLYSNRIYYLFCKREYFALIDTSKLCIYFEVFFIKSLLYKKKRYVKMGSFDKCDL